MRIISQSVLMLLLTIALPYNVGAQDFSKAGEYLSYMGTEYTKIAKEEWDYIKAIGKGKRDKVIDKKRSDLLLAMAESKRVISKMPPFGGSAAFRDTVISYLKVSQIVINQDYGKIINMEEIAEQSYDNMEAYMMAKEKASEKMAEASERVQVEQDRFIAENNIRIANGDESKLSKRMREAGEVFTYYNKIYLLFFKPYKQEAYLIDAMNVNDINAIEQNRNALLNYSLDSRDKLKESLSFKYDETLSTACREMMNFYINEAEKQIPIQIDYFTAKEQFEKIKKSFDLIKPNARTQKDIDTYNNAINEYNASLKKFNDVNKKQNDSRAKVLDNWNKKRADFFQKHMP